MDGIQATAQDDVNCMDAAIAMYTGMYPAACTELTFLQAILTFQAERVIQITPAPMLALEEAHARWQSGQHLLDARQLAAPHSYLRETLAALRPVLADRPEAQAIVDCLLAVGLDESATEGVGRFVKSPNSGSPDVLSDLEPNRFICGHHERSERLAAAIAVDPALLSAVLRIALAPLYQQRAAPYQGWIDPARWRQGACPLCGAEPGMACLAREDGRRVLVCSLCRSAWVYARLRCPFCATDQRAQLRHFTAEADPAHRVECCAQCHRYLKTVDERRIDYQPFIPAEEIVTMHLDVLAREQGYQ